MKQSWCYSIESIKVHNIAEQKSIDIANPTGAENKRILPSLCYHFQTTGNQKKLPHQSFCLDAVFN